MVDDETAEHDAETFDCEACPIAAALDDLDPMNCQVWALYQQVVARLGADLQTGGVVLERLTREMDADEFADVWRRLRVLYDALQPVPDPPTET